MGNRKKANLVLEDGSVYRGYTFGSEATAFGEVVFNTSMTGYQEILTDPSYRGQMVTMTYPLIGNYGINPDDSESSGVQVSGFIIKELSGISSSWRQKGDLEPYLTEHRITGILGIDTRALVRKLRNHGVMRGIISSENQALDHLVGMAKAVKGFEHQDVVAEVTTKSPYFWDKSAIHLNRPAPVTASSSKSVLVYDFGVKRNILCELVHRGCRVEVVPATTAASDALGRRPDGILLSNGPGDPRAVPYLAKIVSELLGRVPVMGICLGHQILAMALGGDIFKLKFGHRGANQPVAELSSGKVTITSQNHGYAVDRKSLENTPVTVSHINLNDETVEGMWSEELDLFSVQYHPEASPGPHDASHLFDRFMERIDSHRSVGKWKGAE